MNSPRYLNLFKIALPAAGVSSILHRLSAVAIFVLSLPMMALLVFALNSKNNYSLFLIIYENLFFKITFTIFITAIFYHFVSGLRHLVMDFGYWETLRAGRLSAISTFFLTAFFLIIFLMLTW